MNFETATPRVRRVAAGSRDHQVEGRMESPCVKVCVIDEASGLCAGCYRSLGEIATWASIGLDGRRRIMAELPARAGLIGAGMVSAGMVAQGRRA